MSGHSVSLLHFLPKRKVKARDQRSDWPEVTPGKPNHHPPTPTPRADSYPEIYAKPTVLVQVVCTPFPRCFKFQTQYFHVKTVLLYFGLNLILRNSSSLTLAYSRYRETYILIILVILSNK